MLSCLSAGAQAASYEVVELPTQELSTNQFSESIDNTGLMLVTASRPFNPPIDLSLIDLSLFNLTDPDAAAQGNFNITDYTILTNYIYSESLLNGSVTNVNDQKLATNIAFSSDTVEANYVSGFDAFSEELDNFSFAQEIQIGDSVNGTHIVGAMEGPYQILTYTNENQEEITFNISLFVNRAFVQVGNNVVELLPENILAGGYSRAFSINQGLMIAGVTGIEYVDGLQTTIDNCLDDEIRIDEPAEVCLYRVHNVTNNGFVSSIQRRAVVWQVDANGELIDKVVYGLAFEPTEEDTGIYISQATDINDAGVAVGSSSVPINTVFTDAATIFENGEVIRIIEDDDSLPNLATGINNNNIIVGYRGERINGITRTKMFVFNRETGDLRFPDGFFVSSSNVPRAINNNNLVVGEAEVDSINGTRRRNGFLYDIDTDTFTNLNDLLPCESPFSIVGANDINDNNEIIANALVRRPARGVDGEILLNADSEQVLIDTVVAVKLSPTGQATSECGLTDEEISEFERQGASVSFFSLIGLFGLVVVRLFRNSRPI